MKLPHSIFPQATLRSIPRARADRLRGDVSCRGSSERRSDAAAGGTRTPTLCFHSWTAGWIDQGQEQFTTACSQTKPSFRPSNEQVLSSPVRGRSYVARGPSRPSSTSPPSPSPWAYRQVALTHLPSLPLVRETPTAEPLGSNRGLCQDMSTFSTSAHRSRPPRKSRHWQERERESRIKGQVSKIRS